MVESRRNDLSDQADVLAVILAPGPVDELCLPLAGCPLVAYSAAAAMQVRRVGYVLVAGDPRLAEVVRQSARQKGRLEIGVESLPLPAGAHLDAAALTFALDQWVKQRSSAGEVRPVPRMDLVVMLQADWPLYPKGALDKAIELLRKNPQAGDVVSLVPVSLASRWWGPGAGGSLAPLASMPGDLRLYAETGHFRVFRLSGGSPNQITLPIVLDPQVGVNAADPHGRQWAEWRVQFSGLDIVYPGYHPRPLPEKVALLVMDFDGVLTDNRVWVDESGHEHIAANRSDSLGLAFLRRAGIEALVISMETNPVVTARCRKMQVPVLQGINDKATVLSQYLADHAIDPGQVVYLGNDVNDLVCFPLVACAVAVADSLPAVLQQADLVLASRGGHAAVRELCDLLILRAGK